MYSLPRRGQRGYTFIELMMTLVIMSILAWVAIPSATMVVRQHQERELQRALIQIREALDAYKRAADQGHITQEPGSSGYPPSLEDLVNGVIDARNPQRKPLYFLRRIPRDPFNTDLQTPAAETWGLRSYASPPDAPEAGVDVYDVYSRSERVGLNGIPYSQW